ncbi:hypothetical protein HP397_01440 [Streptobacillus felis]|uniref:MORN repeat protein n=1 Tax=Streptobacillus felis TaxID=1384509 RepID=A0A7Z0PE45_9FUSO|nr:hypothetical protein [Streptobacillus felis]NYV27492.1 hypothetical protein [Streptobacillus felis]
MKKIFTMLLLLQLFLFSKEEVEIINGFKQGPFIETLDDGSIEKGTYVNNVKNGEFTLEVPEINLLLKGTYLNGFLNGVEKVYKDGNFVGEITYFQNEQLGEQLEYIDELTRSGYMGMNRNGYFELKTPDSVISFKEEDALINGQVIINKNNGDKIYLTMFEGITLGDIKYVKSNGEIKFYEYLFDIDEITPSEEKFLETIYLYLEENKVEKINNLKQGDVKIEIDDVKIEYSYVNNEINGTVKLIFPEVTKEINFKDGKRDGESKYTIGSFTEIKRYKNDLLDGMSIRGNQNIYYTKGRINKIVNHIDDNSFVTINFVNEKPVGNLTITENGIVRIEGTYDENHILVFDGKDIAKDGDKVLLYDSKHIPMYIIVIKENGEKRQYKKINDYLENKEYVIIK